MRVERTHKTVKTENDLKKRNQQDKKKKPSKENTKPKTGRLDIKVKSAARYKFFVTDWKPNGLNDLIVRYADTLEQADYLEDVLFGVNVSNLGSGQYFDAYDDCPEYRISKELIKRHVANSPIEGEFEHNCQRLSKYLRGAK